jgi:hypothetical protein
MMTKQDLQFYRDRWQAVAAIERAELRALTVEQSWQQINRLRQFALDNGLTRNDDDGEMEVWLRWAKLKQAYVATK